MTVKKGKEKFTGGIAVCTAILFAFSLEALASPGNTGRIMQDYARAERLYNLENPTMETDREAIELFLRVAGSSQPVSAETRIKSLLWAGNIHQGYNRFNESKGLYHMAMAINRQNGHRRDFAYESCLYLGTAMYYTGIIDSARYYFEKASVYTAGDAVSERLPEQDRLYNSLGVIYYESGNYQQAINYFQTALNFISTDSDQYGDFYNNIQSNTANCLLKLHYFDSSIRIFRKLVADNPGNTLVAQNLAHALLERGLTDSALVIYERLNLPAGFGRIIAQNEMGRIHLARGNYKKAEACFATAIEENKKLTGNVKNKEEALSYLYRSQLAYQSGFLNESLLWVNRALKEVQLSATTNDIYYIPNDVSASVSPITFFQVLVYKAGLVYEKYKREGNETYLFRACRTYLKAVELFRYILKNFDNDEARMFFIENSRNLFDDAVKTAYEASAKDDSYLDDVLRIMESYKGNVLYQTLQDARQKHHSSVPEGLLAREFELKQSYAAYLTQLNQTTNEKEATIIQKKIASLKVEISRLQKQFPSADRSFFFSDELYGPGDYLAGIRNKIGPGTLLMNYFVSGDDIYLFYLSRSEAQVIKTGAGKGFHDLFSRYISQVYRITDGLRFDAYGPGHQLYNILVKPVADVASRYPQWVIVPDEYLYYLPFEALSSAPGRDSYLLLNHTISYHYSLNLLLNEAGVNPATGKTDSLLAFAPFAYARVFEGPGRLQNLPYSGSEAGLDRVLWFSRDRATRDNFMARYPFYRYIHLGTHASLSSDSTNSWILFHDATGAGTGGKLYLHEIYNLNLHGTDLVTLSACQTAGGESVSGEGLLSLSRAFLYAGSKGIVSTLYKTDDKVTAFIMSRMYDYLDEGLPVEEALRKSKIDFLQSKEINPKLKTANFWANFIYIGKISGKGAASRSGFQILGWLVAAGAVWLIYFLYRRLKRFQPDAQ